MRVRRTTGLATIALLGAVLAACGSTSSSGLPTAGTTSTAPATTTPTTSPATSTSSTTTTPTTTPPTSPPTTAANRATTPHASGVGSTLRVSMAGKGFTDTKAEVTLEAIVDPATPQEFNAPPAGDRLVAAKIRISALGTISDDADNDASLVASNDQTYTASFDSIVGCTDFNDGEVRLTSGESLTGCVDFEVPKSVTPKVFSFGDELGTVGQWRLGKGGGGAAASPASLSLRLSDLPAGWVDKGASPNHRSGGTNSCPGVKTSKTTGDVYSDSFQSPNGLQDADSDVSVASSADAAKSDLSAFRSARALACVKKLASEGIGQGNAITSVQHLSFSGAGVPAQNAGYRFDLTVQSNGRSIPAVLDLAVFAAGRLEAEVQFVGVEGAVPTSVEDRALAGMARGS